MLELKDALETATDERDRVHEMNTYLSEQNTKLKEESATLITGIQSLKDSNMMLQVSETYFVTKNQTVKIISRFYIGIRNLLAFALKFLLKHDLQTGCFPPPVVLLELFCTNHLYFHLHVCGCAQNWFRFLLSD